MSESLTRQAFSLGARIAPGVFRFPLVTKTCLLRRTRVWAAAGGLLLFCFTAAAPPPFAVLDLVPGLGTNVIRNYSVYWGVASRSYTNQISSGLVLSAAVTNLAYSTTYYFAATATDTDGLESNFSSEVFTNTPPPPLVPPLPATNLRIRLGP